MKEYTMYVAWLVECREPPRESRRPDTWVPIAVVGDAPPKEGLQSWREYNGNNVLLRVRVAMPQLANHEVRVRAFRHPPGVRQEGEVLENIFLLDSMEEPTPVYTFEGVTPDSPTP